MTLWPFRPYAPVRKPVAGIYRQLGNFTSEATLLSLSKSRLAAWQRIGQQRQSEIRVAIEQARSALAETRSGRLEQTPREEHLTVLIEASDLLFGWYIALVHLLEELSALHADVLPVLRLAIRQTGEICFWIAEAVQSDNANLAARFPQIEDSLSAITDIFNNQRFESSADGSRSVGFLHSIIDGLQTAGATTIALLRGEAAPVQSTSPSSAVATEPGMADGWRERISADRNVLKYALRLAIIPTLAHATGALLGINHSYWLTFTAVIVMQPTAAATFHRGLQRVEGTVLGGIVAALLAALIGSPFELAGALFPLVTMTLATLPLHYGAYGFFLTPVFVLLSIS